ncbi:MAG: hypothetical protein KJ717_03650 [Proteobacteria bacterium]|nr:hypothetical protein [Pseudomonadota bacterium]
MILCSNIPSIRPSPWQGYIVAGSRWRGQEEKDASHLLGNRSSLPAYRQIVDRHMSDLAGQDGKNIMEITCYAQKTGHISTEQGDGAKSA